MKDLIINIVATGLSSLGTYLVTLLLKSGDKMNAYQLWGLLAVLIVLCSIVLTVFFNRERNKFLANQKFDFKFAADTKEDKEGLLQGLFKKFNRAGFDAVGIDPTVVTAQMVDGKPNESYESAKKFFSTENKILDIFRCRSVRNDQKKGKVFLQVSFIPIDGEGKTIAIERSNVYHPRIFGFQKKRNLSFVSFSPIPPRYCNTSFSIEDVYHNEIPSPWNGCESAKPEFRELGAVIRKDKDAVYMFYVFSVQYPKNILFDARNKDGSPVIKGLFYENEEAYADKRAFVKDHDKIKAILPVKVLQEYVRNGKLPKYPSNPFSRDFLTVFSQRHFLKRTEVKKVESAILTNML